MFRLWPYFWCSPADLICVRLKNVLQWFNFFALGGCGFNNQQLTPCKFSLVSAKNGKLDYWSIVNFLLLKQNTLTYCCLTDTKLHMQVVNILVTARPKVQFYHIACAKIVKKKEEKRHWRILTVTHFTAQRKIFEVLATK